ncbi:MAG: cyclic pyranopterin monophosphate synthase MoaC [Burkholderiales bacterium]|nr:cyclic pyranopterin monophosphate synthase MoaC [Phycisphaerae bacterium]
MPKLSHIDSKGRAKMVDIGDKLPMRRVAIAEGVVHMSASTLRAIVANKIAKGEVLAVARVAGIMAAKRCGELIPLCHPLSLDAVTVDFDLPKRRTGIVGLRIRATASITAKTGVEMEALTAVSVAALTIYDMCKAIDKAMVIDDVRLVSKTKQTL